MLKVCSRRSYYAFIHYEFKSRFCWEALLLDTICTFLLDILVSEDKHVKGALDISRKAKQYTVFFVLESLYLTKQKLL
jgi:hypothetical protein